MSLGDELRYLRAHAGGITPSDIFEETGVEPGLYSQMEQRYRKMGDDETVEKLAEFYNVDAEWLKETRHRSRKALSRFLESALREGQAVDFELRTDETIGGRVLWWDLGAFGLKTSEDDALTVVQRHAVVNW
jgi:transcriptional regulator with XRE-family HTH domain